MEKRSGQKLGNKTLPKSSQAKMREHVENAYVLAMDESAEVMRQEISAQAETRLNLIPFARSTNTEQF